MKNTKAWCWIPTLYFAEGLPYVAVMTLSVIMYIHPAGRVGCEGMVVK